MELSAGDLVTPSVRLERPLGAGAMGTVWVARHSGLDTEVAVKLVSPELIARHPEALTRFEREARAAARIKSPHVVHTYDCGVRDGEVPYIVMELLEGETLAERIERERALAPAVASAVVTQVARALGKAHDAGIVHRDIKPSNIFLLAEEPLFVKVLDFGIAKESHAGDAGGITATGTLLGSPAYMSPEQIKRAKAADLHADLWALAVVAYEMLTGRRPFEGETIGSLILAVCGEPAARPSQLEPTLSPEVDAWFARALAKDRTARFGSARELAESFAELVTGASPPAEQAPTPRRASADALRPAPLARPAPPTEPTEPPPARTIAAAPQGVSAQTADLPGTPGAESESRPARRFGPLVVVAVAAIGGALTAMWIDARRPGTEVDLVTSAHVTSAPGGDALGATNTEPSAALRGESPTTQPPGEGSAALAAPEGSASAAPFLAGSAIAVAPSTAGPAATGPVATPSASAIPVTAPSATPPTTDTGGRLPSSVIQRVIRQGTGRYRACYQSGLETNPNLKGRVTVRFVIGKDGGVSSVSGGGDLPDGAVISCITRAFYGLRFPQPDGGTVTVSYPMAFSPGG